MNEGSRLARAAAWAGTASLALAAIGLVSMGNVRDALVTAAFVGIAVALLLNPRAVPLAYSLAFVGITHLAAAGMLFDLWEDVFFYDELVHCLTSFAVTLTVGGAVFRPMRTAFRRHPLLYLLATASFGVSVGAAWEVYELLVGNLGTAADTASDLFWDALGAGTAGAILALRNGALEALPRLRTSALPARSRG